MIMMMTPTMAAGEGATTSTTANTTTTTTTTTTTSPTSYAATSSNTGSSSSSSIEQVLMEMNLNAIRLVCEGEGEVASKLLTDCLVQARHVDANQHQHHHSHSNNYMSSVNASTATSTGIAASSATAAVNASMPSPIATSVMEAVPLMGAMDDDWTGYQTIYFNFYRFLFATEPPHPWDRRTLLSFCVLVMYNLAIIKHELGLVLLDEGGGDSEHKEVLWCARSLYHFALDLLAELHRQPQQQQQQQQLHKVATSTKRSEGTAAAPAAAPPPAAAAPSISSSIDTNLLGMAIYNNLGHLCSFIGDRHGIVQCRQGLEQGLAWASSHQQSVDAVFYQSLTASRRFNNVNVNNNNQTTFDASCKQRDHHH